jgi:hypothetical protein
MEPRRFDAFTRALARLDSRRGVLRRLGVAGSAAILGRSLTATSANADHCSSIGCGCSTGTRHACGGGLVCCPSSPGTPGGAGVCSDPADCGGPCVGSGGGCPGSCNWGDTCPGCCSGYCGDSGTCSAASCTDLGCACASGTFQPCDAGLVCCSSYPGMPGAQGTCQYSCG